MKSSRNMSSRSAHHSFPANRPSPIAKLPLLLLAVCLLPLAPSRAADGFWQGASPSWAAAENWKDGTPPSDGGTAHFAAGATTFTNDIPGLVLGGIVATNRTASENTSWTLGANSLPFAFPADPAATSRIDIAHYLHIQSPLGTGAGTLRKEGTGALALYTNSLFTGRWLVTAERLELKDSSSLMDPPATLIPDALTLDGGAVKNNDSSPVLPPTLGITLGPGGGSFVVGWQAHYSITLASPITGPGELRISQNNGRIFLQNPANDYAGGTWVGTNGPGWNLTGNAPPSNLALLVLGADDVLPYGPGKGPLTLSGAHRGTLDLAGHSNRVTALTATAGAVITNSVPGAGALYADSLALRGGLRSGAALVWCGGAFDVQSPDGSNQGDIIVPDGAPLAFAGPAALGGASLRLNGSAVTLPAADGAETPAFTNSGTLVIGPAGASLGLDGPAPLPAVLLRSSLAEAPDNTAHAPLTLNTSLVIDGPAAAPVFFDAELALPAGAALTLRGSVWLARLPPAGQWSADPGADLYFAGGPDLLADIAALDGIGLHITADNLADFPSPVAIASGSARWFDTLARVGTLIADSPGNTLAADLDIALSGGTLGLTGQGTVTLSGAVSGAGALVKTGPGTAVLAGANTFSGPVTVSNGTLAAASAAALGASGNPVTLADGGRLANAPGTDVTLAQPVTVVSGGFTVSGGSLRLAGGLTLPANGELNKQGDGELILDGAAFTAPDILALTGGAVILDVPAGATNTIPSLRGAADLIKRGPGTLMVTPHSAYTGRVVLEAGVLAQPSLPPPAATPAFWLDASAADTFTLSGGNRVVRWNDRRDAASGTAYPHAFLNELVPASTGIGYKTALPPTLLHDTFAGRPVVDFGIGKSGQWLEFTEIPNARTIFWVIGSANGGGQLIGSPDQGTARQNGNADVAPLAADGLWNNSSWNGANFRASQNWINGVSVPISAGLSGTWDLVATQTSADTRLNGLAREMRPLSNTDSVNRSGGQQLAELLIYTRILTADERAATEAYLRAKWFGAASYEVWTSGLDIAGDAALHLPGAQNSLRLASLTGPATLTQTGAGTLTVEAPESFGGTLALAEGTFTADGPIALATQNAAPSNPVPGAAFWVDAGAEDSFGKDDSNRVFWRDARWQEPGDWLVATQRWAVAPTLISNAVGTLPVVDMGPTNTQAGMQWSANLDNVRTVFWLIGSQQGGGILLGGNDDNISNFNRARDNAPPPTPIYSTYTAAAIRNGIMRIDSIPVDGFTTGLSGGYQVLALRTTGDVFAGQFAHDRELAATAKRHGGQRLGECIVYTNALSDADFAAVEAYLLAKWQRPHTRDVPATLNHLDVPAESDPPAPGTLAVGVRELKVTDVSGAGLLQKTGPATLTLGNCEAFSGELTVAEGTLNLPGYGTLPRPPAFWVDASRADTLTLAPGTLNVLRWDDCRFNGLYAERLTASPNLPGLLAEHDLNGMNTVDLGAFGGDRNLSWSQPLTHIRTVFWVLGSQEGGGLLLSYDRDTGTRDFYRAGGGVNESDLMAIAKDNPIWSKLYPCPPVNNGQTRLNGVTVDGETTGLSGGYDLISLRTTGDARASSFGNDRKRQYRNATGGQRLAEVIVYEEALTDDEIRQIENYLHLKWNLPLAANADVLGASVVSPMTLTLRGGAGATLGGTHAHELGALGGIGTVSEGELRVSGLNLVGPAQPGDTLALTASLTVEAGAAWHIAALPEGIAPITSSAGIIFAGGGSVSINGAADLPSGDHLLAAATDGAPLTGFVPSAWTIASDDPSRQFSLFVADGAVYLRVSAKGLLLLLK